MDSLKKISTVIVTLYSIVTLMELLMGCKLGYVQINKSFQTKTKEIKGIEQKVEVIHTNVSVKGEINATDISNLISESIDKKANEYKINNEKKASNYSRIEVPFEVINQDHLMVVLTFGQSQAANYGETKYASRENVYNYYDGKFYTAVDPLLGTTGNRGSVWTRLGDKIIQQGLYDNVLFVPIAVGASSIDDWLPGGDFYDKIITSFDELKENYNLEFTHMFWHQGSADSWLHTQENAEEYKADFMQIVEGIRSHGINAPIYVCVSTYSYGNSDPFIQQAQKDLVNPECGIYAGPDSDSISSIYNFDGVHLNNKGLDKLADGWLHSIVSHP